MKPNEKDNKMLCSTKSWKNNLTQFNFHKNVTKRRRCADYIESNSNVVTHKCDWVTVFITWSLLLFILLQIVWYVLSCFSIFYLNHSSVHLWGMNVCCQTYTTIRLPSLQSAMPIQTKRSDERVKNSDRKYPFKAPIWKHPLHMWNKWSMITFL